MVTVADRYPIPDINEVLAQLGDNKIFSVLDLKSGFHQILLKESDIEKTAFSINNGKYEFTRLPFGLKNAPSIFQRALDDILHEHIGKICFIYIDDIIIFSKDDETHYQNLDTIFRTLQQANMKCQLDKCEFMKRKVEFLGFVVSDKGIETSPTKVQAISDFPIPRTLKELRSFLGLSGYYRRFIPNYAKLAKPLSSLLRGEDGRISRTLSSKKSVSLNREAIEAFKKLKSSLVSPDVILHYPDFKKEFHLTTDASNFAVGAVLSQENRPISFLSRTLSKAEENYATNEKEMLAIIWALKKLKIYLYGKAKVKIFTDHQPLTHSLSSWNGNARIKRWKAYLEEYDYEIFYKPGRENTVADALSRGPTVEQINTVASTMHSSDSSSHGLIPSVEAPINAFKNQIFFRESESENYSFSIPFPTFQRHLVDRNLFTPDSLLSDLKEYLNPSVINGIFTSEDVMGKIQILYPIHFQGFKIRFCQSKVKDLVNEAEQEEEILRTHNRAHRNAVENKAQLSERVYFPKMRKKVSAIVNQCLVCKTAKYDRHPTHPEIRQTPLPEYPGQIIHIDIYSTERHLVLTAIDKFSKLAMGRVIKSKAVEDIRKALRDIVFYYGVPKLIVMDNEKSLNSASIKFMLTDQLGIELYKAPPYKSTVNGQIERFHSTLSEIMRCLKGDGTHRGFEELLDRAIYEYNYTVHSVTKKRPLEVFFGRIATVAPEKYEQARLDNIDRLRQKQETDIEYHNRTRKPIKTYIKGQEIFVRVNTRLGSKLSSRFRKELVKEDRSTTILTESGKLVHKSNIRS